MLQPQPANSDSPARTLRPLDQPAAALLPLVPAQPLARPLAQPPAQLLVQPVVAPPVQLPVKLLVRLLAAAVPPLVPVRLLVQQRHLA